MSYREKMIELLGDFSTPVILMDVKLMDWTIPTEHIRDSLADHLIANGATFAPAVPGPSEDDHNIMELCFHNGEIHMKEKVCRELTRIAEHMPCITLAQEIQLLEGL